MKNRESEILYLLPGNGGIKAWFDDCLPYFSQIKPVPIELPGMGDNTSNKHKSLDELADALLETTRPGQKIFAVGINGLVVLHALTRRPHHFSETILLAPVGAYLWQRSFVKIMSLGPIRKAILWLLRNYPTLFKRKFTSQHWTADKIARMGEGYRKCRSFEDYFEFTDPVSALDLFEWIPSRITLVWGTKDAVLDKTQLSAWAGIVPRADLQIAIEEEWGHYPYIDDPIGFAAKMEQGFNCYSANTKGGRLQLAFEAGLPVPQPRLFTQLSGSFDDGLYAVRASGKGEDQADASGAGLSQTFLRVAAAEVLEKMKAIFDTGVEQVVVQPYVEAKAGGVAFIRNLSYEGEWVYGHPGQLLEGSKAADGQFCYGPKGGYWNQHPPAVLPMPWEELKRFFAKVLHAFHYMPLDIEWAWDGRQIWLLQARPIISYPWNRSLTSANLDELLPPQVSKAMEHMQQKASLSIGRAYAAWDTRTLEDNEPFTVPFEGASYINLDLFLARFADWGLPSELLAREIGSHVPKLRVKPLHFLTSIPVFIRMLFAARDTISRLNAQVHYWAQKWDGILQESNPDQIAQWMIRYYVFIVRSNIHINAALSSDPFGFLGKELSVYGKGEDKYWRMLHESDPATPRGDIPRHPLKSAFPKWNSVQRWAHRLGLPGMGGKYLEVREWFRDENMKIFYRLHFALRGSKWLENHPYERSRRGTFFENNPDQVVKQDQGLVIVHGEVEGVLGKDILLVEVLNAGDIETYKAFAAVVAKNGGRLSHGATLLREFRIPSAIIPTAKAELTGKKVKLKGAALIEISSVS